MSCKAGGGQRPTTTGHRTVPTTCSLDRLVSTNRRGDFVRPKQDASRSGIDGRDGPSIDGGIGGRGGRAGTGPAVAAAAGVVSDSAAVSVEPEGRAGPVVEG